MNNELPPGAAKLIGGAVLLFFLALVISASSYVIAPGTRGIEVTLGKPAAEVVPEGFGWKMPFITRVQLVNVKQRTVALKADCFSADLQQVMIEASVLYKIPENSVVEIYQNYSGDPFDTLVAPLVQEALKETTASQSAEQIVKKREEIKQSAIAAARQKIEKIGDIVKVVDIVIRNIDLSPEFERAIEAKMVAEQDAMKSRFTQQQTEIEAQTAVIRAKGEAEAIKVRGEALKLNPGFVRLQMVEKWNGRSPLVVPGGVGVSGSELILPTGRVDSSAP